MLGSVRCLQQQQRQQQAWLSSKGLLECCSRVRQCSVTYRRVPGARLGPAAAVCSPAALAGAGAAGDTHQPVLKQQAGALPDEAVHQHQQRALLSGQHSQQQHVQQQHDDLQEQQQQQDQEEQQQQQQQHEQQHEQQQEAASVPHHLRSWRPKWQLERVRSVAGVLRMMQQEGQAFSPALWVRAFVQLERLVGEGQRVPSQGWEQLRLAWTHLTTPAPAAAAAAAAPLGHFTAWQLCTLLWASARLGLQVPSAAWPTLLAQLGQVGPDMSPRDLSLTVWALDRLTRGAAGPAAGKSVGPAVEALLLRQQQGGSKPLASYPPRSLTLLLYSLARLRVQPPPAWQQQLEAALTAQLTPTTPNSSSSSSRARRYSGVDLCLLLWSLPALGAVPPAAVLTAALQRSQRHLTELDCSYLTALLVGVGRLRFVPPGPWLLLLYDQLYWTLDQLTLRQLTGVVWALGRLRLVAVPSQLLDRLLTFVGLRLQQQQEGSDGQPGSPPAAAAAAADAASGKAQVTLARQLSLLLSGLAGLSRQLSPQQQQQCQGWLLRVCEVSSPHTGPQTAAALRSAARLEVSLSSPAERARVFQAVQDLQGKTELLCFAVAVWGAVLVAGRPHQLQQQEGADQQQHQQAQAPLQDWLQSTTAALASAPVGLLHMLLHACVLAQQLPSEAWWGAAAARLQQLVPQMSSRNCVFLSQLLLSLLLQQQHQQQQQQLPQAPAQQSSINKLLILPPLPAGRTKHKQQQPQLPQPGSQAPQPAPESAPQAAAAAAGVAVTAASVAGLLALLSRRVEQLEVRQHIAGRSLQNYERNCARIRQLLQGAAGDGGGLLQQQHNAAAAGLGDVDSSDMMSL